MFEKASRLKLRFPSNKGNLSVEDLWDLNLTQLNTLAKGLKKQLKESQEDDFLIEKSEEDTNIKLQFDIVIKVLQTKLTEKRARETKEANKATKEKLLQILEKKKHEEFESMSQEDLMKKINELDV